MYSSVLASSIGGKGNEQMQIIAQPIGPEIGKSKLDQGMSRNLTKFCFSWRFQVNSINHAQSRHPDQRIGTRAAAGILIYSLASQVSLPTAVQNVVGGIVGIVSNLGNAIGHALSGIIPRPGGN